jgi:hypothetical protein
VNPKRKQARLRPVYLAVASLAVLIAAGDDAGARSGKRSIESIESRSASEPLMAIVSLRDQRITVYDAKGWILRAPVSSGTKGRETPAGIFSVIQKVEDHYSNLYDDAYMPHMQRITWSGIALHGGALPGYPASHGCVRLPFDFAARLFDATAMGMRVIVAPTDVAPVEIAHPVLFQPKPGAAPLPPRVAQRRKRRPGKRFRRDSTPGRLPGGDAGNDAGARGGKSEAQSRGTIGGRRDDAWLRDSAEAKQQAEGAKAQAAARIAELQVQWDAAKAELQPKLDAVTAARKLPPPETARAAAAEAARAGRARARAGVGVDQPQDPAAMSGKPLSRSLKVRSRSQIPIVRLARISSPPSSGRAATPTCDGPSSHWAADVRPAAQLSQTRPGARGSGRDVEPMPTDPDSANAALDRMVIPQDVLDRIAEIAPRSSLIVTDEALSSETGKGTDFVVLLSGEPQGGIKSRRRSPGTEFRRYARPRDRLFYWPSPFGSPFSAW